MRLNELRDEAYAYAKQKGFHDEPCSLGERLMLIVSELSEALEADRKGRPFEPNKTTSILWKLPDPENVSSSFYENNIKGSVAEEIADAIIRLCDFAGVYDIDIEWHVKAKMAYNKTRPFKHGKKY